MYIDFIQNRTNLFLYINCTHVHVCETKNSDSMKIIMKKKMFCLFFISSPEQYHMFEALRHDTQMSDIGPS